MFEKYKNGLANLNAHARLVIVVRYNSDNVFNQGSQYIMSVR